MTDTRIIRQIHANWGVPSLHKNIPLILVLMAIIAVFLLDQWGYFDPAATQPTKVVKPAIILCKQPWGCYGDPRTLTGSTTERHGSDDAFASVDIRVRRRRDLLRCYRGAWPQHRRGLCLARSARCDAGDAPMIGPSGEKKPPHVNQEQR